MVLIAYVLLSVPSMARRTSLMDLAPELRAHIIAYAMASEVPLQLQDFIAAGQQQRPAVHSASRSLKEDYTSTETYSNFLAMLHPSQKEHYTDWLAVNGTSREFRQDGKLAFFSEKIFVIGPALLQTLKNGSCRNLTVPDRMALLERARHVVIGLSSLGMARHFWQVSEYNAFARLRVLSIQPFVSFPDEPDNALPALEWSSSTAEAAEPVRQLSSIEKIGTLKRHPAPGELVNLLRSVGLRSDVEVDLVHRDTREWRRYVVDELVKGVYPYLRFKRDYTVNR